MAEIVGQEHITDTLSKALKSGRISHAYLFSGPRGVGKTSIARIMAHEINDLPYTDDTSHLDIIEIDAASNRRIDEIRELRDKVYIAPSVGKYKVYIIDEVHMLTREAFNALLKTLEEPPEHAVFILATTEAHKLPETIVSRTQHYTFKPVESDKVIRHLAAIAKSEGISISPDALGLLAAHGQGSFRDSISLLDQAGSIEGRIEVSHIRQLLGIAPDETLDSLLAMVSGGAGGSDVLASISSLYDQGYQAAAIASQLSAKLRKNILNNDNQLPKQLALQLMRELIEVPASFSPERRLEIVMMEASNSSPTAAALETRPQQTSKPAPAEKAPAPPVLIPKTSAPEKAQAAAIPQIETATAGKHELDGSLWPQVLDEIRKQYNTLYGVLRMANPVFDDGSLELQCKFAFHQKRLNEAKNRQIIAGCINQVTGKKVTIKCTVNKDATPPAAAPAVATKESGQALDSITDIFGGGEMLHS